MTAINRQWRLASYPDGMPAAANWTLSEDPMPEPGHIAFVATQSGYELVECESQVPEIGSELALPSFDGQFRVMRIGPSPLPLDRRRCAYLEPLRVSHAA